jgi:hypothetical protein
MATINILDLIFNEFLRINPSTISQYSTPQLQLLNLFLIPHIILFLFIYGFAWVIAPTHKGFRYLFSIAAYLTMVMMGSPYSYYGMILPFLLVWWQIALGLAFFFFIASRIIHPSKYPELFNIGKSAAEKITEKSKKHEVYSKKIESVEAQIRALEVQQNRMMTNSGTRNPMLDAEISELYRRKAELEKEL